MTEQPTLGLPPSPGEPDPYEVRVWRYKSMTPRFFVLPEDAVEFARAMLDSDDCAVEGIFRGGQPDEALSRAADPGWRGPYPPERPVGRVSPAAVLQADVELRDEEAISLTYTYKEGP